jgi:non-ribosomal peptide synthetase component F
LFDTAFTYENYPVDTAALASNHGLAVTDFSNREANHYPLTVQVLPGDELDVRVEFDSEVFDVESVAVLIERLRRVLVAMTVDVGGLS